MIRIQTWTKTCIGDFWVKRRSTHASIELAAMAILMAQDLRVHIWTIMRKCKCHFKTKLCNKIWWFQTLMSREGRRQQTLAIPKLIIWYLIYKSQMSYHQELPAIFSNMISHAPLPSKLRSQGPEVQSRFRVDIRNRVYRRIRGTSRFCSKTILRHRVWGSISWCSCKSMVQSSFSMRVTRFSAMTNRPSTFQPTPPRRASSTP